MSAQPVAGFPVCGVNSEGFGNAVYSSVYSPAVRSMIARVLSRPQATRPTLTAVAPKLTPQKEFAEFPIHEDGLP